ncbi:MAG TPA: substrate-binding domain-containing protein [Dissulfurispiraceae bacterium]|nr:substrate-binding domain-containing protein [Dissulfurispiraceae bacterium]
MRRFLCRSVGALAMLATLFTTPAYSHETIKIGSIGAAAGMMKTVSREFEKHHRTIKVKVLPIPDPSGGIQAVSENAIDIGVTSRSLRGDEKKRGLVAVLFARTPLTPVSNRDVAIKGLKTHELVSIYQGKTLKWPNGKQVRLIMRPAAETDMQLIRKISPEMRAAVDNALSRPGMNMARTDQDNLKKLERVSGAVGFATLSQVLSEGRSVSPLAFNGLAPSVEAVAKGRYPVVKSFYFVRKKDPSPEERAFIAFLLSAKGRKILKEAGCAPAPGAPAR